MAEVDWEEVKANIRGTAQALCADDIRSSLELTKRLVDVLKKESADGFEEAEIVSKIDSFLLDNRDSLLEAFSNTDLFGFRNLGFYAQSNNLSEKEKTDIIRLLSLLGVPTCMIDNSVIDCMTNEISESVRELSLQIIKKAYEIDGEIDQDTLSAIHGEVDKHAKNIKEKWEKLTADVAVPKQRLEDLGKEVFPIWIDNRDDLHKHLITSQFAEEYDEFWRRMRQEIGDRDRFENTVKGLIIDEFDSVSRSFLIKTNIRDVYTYFYHDYLVNNSAPLFIMMKNIEAQTDNRKYLDIQIGDVSLTLTPFEIVAYLSSSLIIMHDVISLICARSFAWQGYNAESTVRRAIATHIDDVMREIYYSLDYGKNVDRIVSKLREIVEEDKSPHEFFRVRIEGHGQVALVAEGFYLEDIDNDWDSTDYCIQEFLVRFDGDFGFRISSDPAHPHVDSGGAPCLGDTRPIIIQAFKDGDFDMLLDGLESFARGYDASSAYFAIEGRECALCEEILREDEVYCCYGCDMSVCEYCFDNHFFYCEYCERQLCGSCAGNAVSCRSCGTHMCEHCAENNDGYYCSYDEFYICRECLESGKAADYVEWCSECGMALCKKCDDIVEFNGQIYCDECHDYYLRNVEEQERKAS